MPRKPLLSPSQSGQTLSNMRNPSALEIQLKSLNPWTLPSSILPLLLGTILAWKDKQEYDVWLFVLCSLVVVGTHAAGNFVNSYYEAKVRRFYTRASERHMTIHESARCAVATYCIVIPAFGFLLVFSGANLWQELLLFAVGFLGSVMFGNCLKDSALGELVVSAIYGPLCVMFTYAVQVGSRRELSATSLAIYALPLALNTECMLYSQNIRDIKHDSEQGARTLAVLLGNHNALATLPLFLLSPYVVTSILGLQLSKYFFFPLLSLPLAFLAIPSYQHELLLLPQKTAVLGLVFGLLYLLSFLYNAKSIR